MACLTLWVMYSYDKSILEGIELPEGMDENILTSYILMYCGHNKVRYPSLPLLSNLIHEWFISNKRQFERLWYTVNVDYEPIENYDRKEEYEKKGNTKGKSTAETSSTENTNGSSDRVPNTVNEKEVSAFDSPEYQKAERNTETGNEKTTVKNENIMTAKNENNSESGQEESFTMRAHGNIGVTTTQEMLEQERCIANYNIYKDIALKFEDEFTICVY